MLAKLRKWTRRSLINVLRISVRLSDHSLLYSTLCKLVVALSWYLSGHHLSGHLDGLRNVQWNGALRRQCEWCLSCLTEPELWLILALAHIIILGAHIALIVLSNLTDLLPHCWRWIESLLIRPPTSSTNRRVSGGAHGAVAST